MNPSPKAIRRENRESRQPTADPELRHPGVRLRRSTVSSMSFDCPHLLLSDVAANRHSWRVTGPGGGHDVEHGLGPACRSGHLRRWDIRRLQLRSAWTDRPKSSQRNLCSRCRRWILRPAEGDASPTQCGPDRRRSAHRALGGPSSTSTQFFAARRFGPAHPESLRV